MKQCGKSRAGARLAAALLAAVLFLLTAQLPARAALPADTVLLRVETVLQNPELPNGCEVTSAAMVLSYMGYPVDKVTLAKEYLPQNPDYRHTDPEKAYMGDPAVEHEGWYCYTGPVVEAMNGYLSTVDGAAHAAADISGAETAFLEKSLRMGIPVIFWATVGFGELKQSKAFRLPNGEYPYIGIHCMVLIGYDREFYYIADPLGGTTQVEKSLFKEAYNSVGKRAVIMI